MLNDQAVLVKRLSKSKEGRNMRLDKIRKDYDAQNDSLEEIKKKIKIH